MDIDELIGILDRHKVGDKEFILSREADEWVAAIGNKSEWICLGEAMSYGDDGAADFHAKGPTAHAALFRLLAAVTSGEQQAVDG